VLDQDVTVGIIFTGPELDVTPLDRDQLRFTDHFVAKGVIAAYADARGLAVAFTPGGSLHVIAGAGRALLLKPGLLEALAVQVPEKFGQELITGDKVQFPWFHLTTARSSFPSRFS